MSLSNALELLGGVAGLSGVVFLAIPALHANKYGRLIARLNASNTRLGDQAAQERNREIARAALKGLQDSWTPFKANCLIVGTALAGLSSLITMVKVLVT